MQASQPRTRNTDANINVDLAGIAMEGNCTLCSSGRFCNMTGLSMPAGECLAGSLCIEGATHPSPNDGVNGPCPKGKYCELGESILW